MHKCTLLLRTQGLEQQSEGRCWSALEAVYKSIVEGQSRIENRVSPKRKQSNI